MTILFLTGLGLFIGLHLFSALRSRAPDRDLRQRVGEARYMGIYSLVSLAAFIAMIFAYTRLPDGAPLWTGPGWARTLALPLNLAALTLLVAAYVPTGYLKRAVHHPMMIGTLIWAGSHLLVGGDWAKVGLMSGFALYALVSVTAAFRRGERVTAPPRLVGDLLALTVGAAVALGMLWLGHGGYL